MGQVFFEFSLIGTIARVSATDEDTGTEVIIQGPRNAGKLQLQRVAMNKLRYVLNKKSEGKTDET